MFTAGTASCCQSKKLIQKHVPGCIDGKASMHAGLPRLHAWALACMGTFL